MSKYIDIGGIMTASEAYKILGKAIIMPLNCDIVEFEVAYKKALTALASTVKNQEEVADTNENKSKDK